MEISHSSLSSDVYLVALNGALNARSAEDAKQTFRDLSNKGATQVIVDLAGVPFIDSSGLAALVSGLKTFGGDAKNLRLAAPQSQAKLLFELTMFDRVFQIYESVSAAQEAE
ncbi:MAG: STAS domain-containing protein [Chloroflexota bacterium]